MRNPKEVRTGITEPAAIKKSFNISADLSRILDGYIQQNPGISFTLIVNQAITDWLRNPNISLKRSAVTDKQVDEFMAENSDLLDDLSR